MKHAVEKLTIKGFKSIQHMENFELKKLNVLIGGNGAG
jgi:predicted ATPase